MDGAAGHGGGHLHSRIKVICNGAARTFVRAAPRYFFPSKESIYNSLIYISSTAPEVSFSCQQFGGDDERKFRRPVDASARKPPRRRWIPGYTDIPSVFDILVYGLFNSVRRNGNVAHRLDGLRKARFDAFRVDIRRRLWYILSTNRKVGFGFGRQRRGESIGGLDACWLIFCHISRGNICHMLRRIRDSFHNVICAVYRFAEHNCFGRAVFAILICYIGLRPSSMAESALPSSPCRRRMCSAIRCSRTV